MSASCLHYRPELVVAYWNERALKAYRESESQRRILEMETTVSGIYDFSLYRNMPIVCKFVNINITKDLILEESTLKVQTIKEIDGVVISYSLLLMYQDYL